MKAMPIQILVLLMLTATLVTALPREPLSDGSLVKLASNLTNLVCITAKPVAMQPNVMVLCAPGRMPDHSTLLTNREAVYRVYVTPAGAPAMKTDDATFPLGTVILKQKLATPAATVPELYTGMLKREKGFNPACGDWEFFTLSGDAKTVTSRGRMESCMNCHTSYPDSDFVTKHYP
jgi:hypothetical protein